MTTVLIVEDHPVNRDIIGRRLGKRGFTIRFAVDGETAVECAREVKPDIILMDIGLGEGIDGCEATRQIKAIPDMAGIPVIALTASAFETDRQNALAAGCADFDTKPVDLPRLLGKMNQALHS
ncbi:MULTISPECIES: response regulator [unclassified Roseitalea]|uniref:response regulator n=1 Tax=unclassified Roseitalea TaxID=2639107 RepID=UPI00273F494B|nr:MULTISPECIES: response regulator [unclassified Roseitalea]